MKENSDMLDRIYTVRQYDFEKKANIDREELSKKLNGITIEEIKEIIQENKGEHCKKRELVEKLEKLIENYEIKMAYYMEQRYKQGFRDGINLLRQCQ